MPDGQVLDFSGLTKQFGPVLAVDGFSARVEPGAVTGFLGPNGAGKTTTLRILLGLVRASGGTATIGGVPYAKLRNPLQSVGAVLEASSFHPGRSAANHLRVYAQAAGLPPARVDEVLGLVGLADVAGRKVGGFSLGMRQRLGLAYALLGDPGVLVLDEPANGLDPEGIKWLRGLLRELARQGRTVLVSSHLLSEVQQTVDRLLVIARGRLVFQGGLEELVDPSEYATVVDATDRAALVESLRSADIPFEVLRTGITVRGMDTASIGRLAAGAGIALTTLQRRGPALEEVFLELVDGVRVHPSAGSLLATGAPAPAAAVDDDEAADAAGEAAGAEAPAAGAEAADPAEVPDSAIAEESMAEADATGGDDASDREPLPEGAAIVGAGIAGAAAEAAANAEGEGETPAAPVAEDSDDPFADAEAMQAASIAAELDADAGAPPAAASSSGAAFAVAATGVIDIVPRTALPEATADDGDDDADAPTLLATTQSEAPDVDTPDAIVPDDAGGEHAEGETEQAAGTPESEQAAGTPESEAGDDTAAEPVPEADEGEHAPPGGTPVDIAEQHVSEGDAADAPAITDIDDDIAVVDDAPDSSESGSGVDESVAHVEEDHDAAPADDDGPHEHGGADRRESDDAADAFFASYDGGEGEHAGTEQPDGEHHDDEHHDDEHHDDEHHEASGDAHPEHDDRRADEEGEQR